LSSVGIVTMSRMRLRHYVLLTGGWAALGSGALLLPLPVPMPFPVAGVLLLTGAAILTSHSRRFRHGLQYARYRYGWLSRSVETVAVRSPQSVRRMVRRTRPDLIERHVRRRAARDLGAV
jgi:hypothetical protein